MFDERQDDEFRLFREVYEVAPDDGARHWRLFSLTDVVEWWNDREFETWVMERAAGDDKLTYWLQYSSSLHKWPFPLHKWPFLWGKRQLPGDRLKR